MSAWYRVFRYGLLVGQKDFIASNVNLATWLGGYGLRVVTQGIFFAMLGKLIDSPDRLYFLLVGQAVVVGAVNASWAMYGASSERGGGTYPLLVVAPAGLLPSLIGRSFVWFVSGIASSLLAFALLVLLFEVSVPWPEVVFILPLIVLTCLGSYCTALFIGCLLALKPRVGTLLINIISFGLIAVAGVSVPIDYWPAWLEAFANALPLTHGLQAIRIVLAEGKAIDVLRETGYLIALSAAWLLVSMLTADRMADTGRTNGSIEFAD